MYVFNHFEKGKLWQKKKNWLNRKRYEKKNQWLIGRKMI